MEYRNRKDKEQELLDRGKWKREMLSFCIEVVDKNTPMGVRTLVYDMGDDFTSDQFTLFERFFREVNRMFPTVKMFTRGGGLIPTGELGEAAKAAEKAKCTDSTGEKPADTATYK